MQLEKSGGQNGRIVAGTDGARMATVATSPRPRQSLSPVLALSQVLGQRSSQLADQPLTEYLLIRQAELRLRPSLIIALDIIAFEDVGQLCR